MNNTCNANDRGVCRNDEHKGVRYTLVFLVPAADLNSYGLGQEAEKNKDSIQAIESVIMYQP